MSPEKKTKDASAAKAKKVKLVRDSFCMPKDEYAQIELLKQRLLTLGKAVKKSELLRAGVLALARADDDSLQAYLEAVPNLKTGRPASQPEAQVEAAPAPIAPVAASESKKASPSAKQRKAAVPDAAAAVAVAVVVADQPAIASEKPLATAEKAKKAPARTAAAKKAPVQAA